MKLKRKVGEYVTMKQEALTITWTPEGESDIEEMWHQFMNNISISWTNTFRNQTSSFKIRQKDQYKRQQRLEREGNMEELFSTWRTRRGQITKYTPKREIKSKWVCRKEFEKKLAKESKNNPKAFYKYTQSKLKTRTGFAHLAREGTPPWSN